MRTNIVMLAVLAGLGLSSFGAAQAEAKNLSCISGISPSEQRLLRDCEQKPQEEEEIVHVLQVIDPPTPPPEPARIGFFAIFAIHVDEDVHRRLPVCLRA